MPIYGRFVPDYNRARLYSLRGVVQGNGVRESGWWIFKSSIPVVTVQLNEDQWLAFNSLARKHMRTSDERQLEGIAQVLYLGLTEEARSEYPVGAEIGITFGYSGPLDQFFFGNDPLRVMGQQVLRPGVVLVNEILATA